MWILLEAEQQKLAGRLKLRSVENKLNFFKSGRIIKKQQDCSRKDDVAGKQMKASRSIKSTSIDVLAALSLAPHSVHCVSESGPLYDRL